VFRRKPYRVQEYAVGRTIADRRMRRIAELERDALGKTAACGEIDGRLDEARAQIDAGDDAVEHRRQIAGRAADAAARIEQLVARLQSSCEFRRNPAGVSDLKPAT
jgi:uncharacterized protein (DUF3084 family)